ncbi:unnamed protein product [Caenorhabditis nigoni]
MKLSKYPHLVQKEIFYNMDASDLFLLSFVSKNMKKLMKCSQKKRFKRINTIRFDNRGGRLFVYIPFKNFYDEILEISEHEDTKKDYFQLNVSGKMIDFR